ncbi:MAG: methionyl-tRNA formyltransferase [Calditrichaeota bacterium]|nr:methionyl-tRNA formyltransferase [Calditrichota bacterium]MCB9368023.1 methionyl-tRNA formyltransferase [Calditrichota bacterium]
MRVVFCGNPDFALPTLRALLESPHEVVAVVTSPDQPQGRGRKLAPMPVKAFAVDNRLTVMSPERLDDPEFLSELAALRADVLVVVAFRILPRELFAMPKWGALNVHPSLLPKCRGPAPIQWTLLRGETETGVTIIRLTEEIDGGGMLAQTRLPILPDEDFGALHDRLSDVGAAMIVETLYRLEAGEKIHPIEQDESQVTKAGKLKPADYVLDFSKPSAEILNRVRAFSPTPGAVAKSGEFSIKILKAGTSTSTLTLQPGQVKQNQDSIFVGTADTPLSLNEVKPAGRRAMAVAEFLRGRPTLPDRFD